MLAVIHFLIAQGTVPDTVVMIPARGGGLQQVLGFMQLGLLILTYALLAAAVFAAIKMRHAFEQARGSLDDVGRQLRDIADNANRMSTSITAVVENVSTDVASVHETVEYANRRARHAIGTLADRVDELNEAIAIVQESAQGGLIKTIAAFRGVKAGVNAMRGTRGKREAKREAKRDATRRAEREAAPEVPPDLPARPRLRRRARGDN